ncbi:MAG: response regulator [Anaerolineae bacterium]|nr:response regulator [Anaerolineae bacterium]
MSYHVLVVDPNEAFATMLRIGLEEMGGNQVEIAANAREATRAVASKKFDLAIVDMGLTDVSGPRLVRALCHEYPNMRLVVIPLDEDKIPAELQDVNIAGVLPKPFFLPELPAQIAAFMGDEAPPGLEGLFSPPGPAEPTVPVVEEPPAEAEPEPVAEPEPIVELEPVVEEPPSSGPVEQKPLPTETPLRHDEIVQAMSRLAQEVGADAVLLTDGGQLLAHAGRLQERRINQLAPLVGTLWESSTQVARVLKKRQGRFEETIQGSDYLLYCMVLSEGLVLSVVVTGRASLGMIRHRAKETAETVRGLMAT